MAQEFQYVGSRNIVSRYARQLCEGSADFAREKVLPNMLYGKFLKSPYACARIKKVDTSKAEALPGVKAIVTYDDPEIKAMPQYAGYWGVPADYVTGLVSVLSDTCDRDNEVIGVAVAAETEEICDQALKLLDIEWEQLPQITDMREAAREDAPLLHPELSPKSNIYKNSEWEEGDVEKAFSQAKHTAEYDASFALIYHACAEPVRMIASWDKDNTVPGGQVLNVWCPTGSVANIENPLSVMFNIPLAQVRITTPFTGGTFGRRPMLQRCHIICALLAKRTGRPVVMDDSREDDMQITGGESSAHVKIAFDDDGVITASDGKILFNVGARGHMPFPTEMTRFNLTKCKNIRESLQQVYTSKPQQC